jgi:tRNA U34 5-carboxymethylaminomethyl modifying GTPase MnmE/TrmE
MEMKGLMKSLVLALVVAFVFTSCAKQPTQELNDTKAAIDAVVTEKGDIYAKNELKKLNDDMTAANDEIAAQSKKFFKKYGKAKEMLAKIKTDAEEVKGLIPARKEEAKNSALTAQTEAKAAVDEAKALLEKAPKGKGTKADIEAMKADLAGLETSLAEVETAITSEDYFGAKDKATTIKDKAVGISDQIKQAIEKVKGKKK